MSAHDEPLVATLRRAETGELELLSPTVGLYRDAPQVGAVLAPGATLGALEILGHRRPIVAPEGAFGRVLAEGRAALARRPVGYADVLLRLDPSAVQGAAVGAQEAERQETLANVFRAPLAGRFYVRPAPDRPVFVEVGKVIEAGETVCLVEIMKTFHRVAYGGAGLPARCRVVEMLLADGDDVERGQAVFRYEVG